MVYVVRFVLAMSHDLCLMCEVLRMVGEVRYVLCELRFVMCGVICVMREGLRVMYGFVARRVAYDVWCMTYFV